MEAAKRDKFVQKMGKHNKLTLPAKQAPVPQDHGQKLQFVHAMTKTALDHIQHFDSGGTVLSGPETVTNGGAPPPVSGLANALGVGNTFQAGSAKLQPGTNAAQLNAAYSGNQDALQGQTNLANTLTPQAATAVANQNTLAGQFAAEAQGQGPNVAVNELNQATGANVANQAALAAGQRGASGNVGLMARQAAQQGAATQQQAVGQAATLQAQQAIAAQQAQAGLASTQINQAGTATGNLTQAQQGEQAILQNANNAYNQAAVSMQSNINNANAQTAAGNQSVNGGIVGGLLGGASSALASIFAEGGEVKKMAAGGPITGNPLSVAPATGSSFALSLNNPSGGGMGGGINIGSPMAAPAMSNQIGSSLNSFGNSAGKAITAYQDEQAGNDLDDLNNAEDMTAQAPRGMGNNILKAKGGKVSPENPKEKAVAKDNSYSNDKVPAMLSEGEIVLPRSVTMHERAPEKAAEFVRRIKARKGVK